MEPLLDDIAKDKPFTPVFTGHSLDHYNKIIEAHEYVNLFPCFTQWLQIQVVDCSLVLS